MTLRHLTEMTASAPSPIKRIQHVEVTIASGDVFGEVTITATDPDHTVIFPCGWRSTGAAASGYNHFLGIIIQVSDDAIEIDLDSSAPADIIYSLCVVEFMPWAGTNVLWDTLQFSTGQNTATASIPTVETHSVVIVPQGANCSHTLQNLQESTATLAISNESSVFASRNSISANVMEIGYAVLQLNPILLAAPVFMPIGRAVVATLASGAVTQTTTFAGGSVDLNYTSLIWAGQACQDFQVRLQHVKLDTSGTSVTVTANSIAVANTWVRVQVMSWQPRFIRKIQRGVFRQPAGTTQSDIALTGFTNTSKMMLSILGTATDNVAATLRGYMTGRITSNSNLRVERGVGTTNYTEISWEVVEFV